jgi:hypothetical protein
MGKFSLDVLSQPANFDHQLNLVVKVFREIGEKKRFVVEQKCGIRFHEKNGFRGNIVVQLLGMLDVIATDADNFHFF